MNRTKRTLQDMSGYRLRCHPNRTIRKNGTISANRTIRKIRTKHQKGTVVSIFGNTHAIGAAWIIQDRGSQLFRYLQVADNQDHLDIQRVLDEIQSYSGVLFELLRADELDNADESVEAREVREIHEWDAEDESEESDNECEGHESLNGDSMGESVQCDGSCITPTAPETGETVESPEKDKTPRFVAVQQDGRILNKGDLIHATRTNDEWTYQSTTHPRKVYVTAMDDPNGPESWPNMASQEFYPRVFNLGIWDTKYSEWSDAPSWDISDIANATSALRATFDK